MTGGLHVSDLSAGYSNRPVLEHLSLPPIAPGETVALLGPNAAGKSTLLRALAGLAPATGSVQLHGVELTGMPLAARAKAVTYMPQTLPQGVALTVVETVIGALEASPTGQPGASDSAARAMAVLGRVGIDTLAMRGIDELSGGQRQLAALAQALVRSPQLLLLDEPTSALDLNHQVRVLDLARTLAREEGMIAVLVLHDLQAAARIADRVVVLSDGRVTAVGAPEQAITPAVLADVWRVQARIDHCERGSLRMVIDDIL